MLSATLRVCGCRGNVGDNGWAEGGRSCPPPKREKRFKNAVMKKKKSNTTRSHVNPTKYTGVFQSSGYFRNFMEISKLIFDQTSECYILVKLTHKLNHPTPTMSIKLMFSINFP